MPKKRRALSNRHDGIVIAPRDGKFMARVWMADGAGGGRYRSKRFPTAAAAEDWAKQEQAKLRTGAETAGSSKVADVAPLYLEQLRLRTLSSNHIGQVNRLLDRMVAAGINDLRDPGFETHVLRMIANYQACRPGQKTPRPAAPSHKRQMLNMSRSFTRWAHARRHVGFDPLAAARLPKLARTSKTTWTLDELRILVSDDARLNLSKNYRLTVATIERHHGDKVASAAELKVHLSTVFNRLNVADSGDDPLWLPTVLGLYTGARPTEVRAMSWRMIDWTLGDLVLPANTPGNKTRTERRIRLMDELVDILKPRAAIGSACIVSNEVADMAPGVYSDAFQRYCKRIGITELGPHTLRHCCGSLMTAMGIQPVQVLLQLGHDSPIVSKRYSESAPKYREAKAWGDQFKLRERPAPVGIAVKEYAR